MDNQLANTFILDSGEIIIITEIPEKDLEHITFCDSLCRKIEKRYGSKDIYKMMLNGAPMKAIRDYVNCRHDLLMWGYD